MNANFHFVGKRKRAGGAFGDVRQQLHVPVETCDIKGVANEFDAVVFIYDTDEELDVFKKLAQGLNNFCRRGNVINEFVKACDVVSRCEDQVCFVIEKIAGGFGNGEIKQGVFGGFRNGKKRVDWLPISICVVSCEVAHGILGKVDADWSYKAGEFVGGISALNDGGCNVEYYYVNIERQLYCVITEYIGGRCFVGRYNLEKDGFDFCRISIRDGASVSESGIGEKLIGRNEIGCSTACEVQKRERAWYLLEKEFSDNDSCRWYCYGVGQDEFSEESVRYLVRVSQNGILSAYRCDYNGWVHLDRHDEDFVRITTECARQEVYKILSVNDCRELINDINFFDPNAAYYKSRKGAIVQVVLSGEGEASRGAGLLFYEYGLFCKTTDCWVDIGDRSVSYKKISLDVFKHSEHRKSWFKRQIVPDGIWRMDEIIRRNVTILSLREARRFYIEMMLGFRCMARCCEFISSGDDCGVDHVLCDQPDMSFYFEDHRVDDLFVVRRLWGVSRGGLTYIGDVDQEDSIEQGDCSSWNVGMRYVGRNKLPNNNIVAIDCSRASDFIIKAGRGGSGILEDGQCGEGDDGDDEWSCNRRFVSNNSPLGRCLHGAGLSVRCFDVTYHFDLDSRVVFVRSHSGRAYVRNVGSEKFDVELSSMPVHSVAITEDQVAVVDCILRLESCEALSDVAETKRGREFLNKQNDYKRREWAQISKDVVEGLRGQQLPEKLVFYGAKRDGKLDAVYFRLYGGPMFSVKRNIWQETAGLSGDLFCSTNNVSVQVVKDKIEVSDLMPILWVDFRSGLRIIDDVAMSCDKTETVIDLNAEHRSRAKHCTRLGN